MKLTKKGKPPKQSTTQAITKMHLSSKEKEQYLKIVLQAG